MKNLFLAASLFLALSVSFSSCSDDDTTTGTPSNLIGAWTVSEVVINDQSYFYNDQTAHAALTRLFSARPLFNSDNTYSDLEYTVSGTNIYKQLYENAGRWSLSSDSVLTLIDNAGGPDFISYYNNTISSVSAKVTKLTQANNYHYGELECIIPANDDLPYPVLVKLKKVVM